MIHPTQHFRIHLRPEESFFGHDERWWLRRSFPNGGFYACSCFFDSCSCVIWADGCIACKCGDIFCSIIFFKRRTSIPSHLNRQIPQLLIDSNQVVALNDKDLYQNLSQGKLFKYFLYFIFKFTVVFSHGSHKLSNAIRSWKKQKEFLHISQIPFVLLFLSDKTAPTKLVRILVGYLIFAVFTVLCLKFSMWVHNNIHGSNAVVRTNQKRMQSQLNPDNKNFSRWSWSHYIWNGGGVHVGVLMKVYASMHEYLNWH